MRISEVRVKDVFVAGGLPTITYVSRANNIANLRSYLDGVHKQLSLTGPTKSGKTVLCRHLIPDQDCVWLSGGTIRTELDFWSQAVHALGLSTRVTKARKNEQKTGFSLEGGTGILGLIAKITGTRDRTRADEIIVLEPKDPKQAVLDALEAANKVGVKVVVLDDFHFLDRDVQKAIVIAFKRPVEKYDQRVVLTSVSHRGFAIERLVPNMEGRVEHVDIPEWTISELKEIAIKGFAELNLSASSQLINVLAEESMGSPHLMQTLCARVCFENGIKQSPSTRTTLELTKRERFFSDVATQYDPEAVKRFLHMGGSHLDRMERTFSNGETGDVYVVVLTALARCLPAKSVEQRDLIREVQQFVTADVPRLNEVTQVLERISDEAAKSDSPIVEWNRDTREFHIMDPFFAFNLKWGNWGAGPRRTSTSKILASQLNPE